MRPNISVKSAATDVLAYQIRTPIACEVRMSVDQTYSTAGTPVPIVFNPIARYDYNGGNAGWSINTYTVPYPGIYHCGINIHYQKVNPPAGSGTEVTFALTVGGVFHQAWTYNALASIPAANVIIASHSTDSYFYAGELLQVEFYSSASDWLLRGTGYVSNVYFHMVGAVL